MASVVWISAHQGLDADPGGHFTKVTYSHIHSQSARENSARPLVILISIADGGNSKAAPNSEHTWGCHCPNTGPSCCQELPKSAGSKEWPLRNSSANESSLLFVGRIPRTFCVITNPVGKHQSISFLGVK